MNQEHDIHYRFQLTKRELEEIQTLQEKGAAQGVSYKLDPGMNSGIVCSRGGVITGFMTVDCFGGEEVESAAIADNLTDWEKMSAVLRTCVKEKNARRILFICDPKDTLIKEKLGSMGLTLSFSEYRMMFDKESFIPARIDGISLRQAVQADDAMIKKLDREAFGNGEGDMPPHDIARTQMILRQGEPVGKLRTGDADGMQGIYGVVVDSRLRGRGIGYQALTLLLRKLTESGASGIYLEVDSQNPAAFHLYQKLGFRIKSEFGYYPCALSGEV